MASLLLLAGCSTTGKTVTACNDPASTETAQYISYVDDLIQRRDPRNTDMLEFHQDVIGKSGYHVGGTWDYFRQDSINADPFATPFDWGDRILYEEDVERMHLKEYYRDGKLVAVIVAHDRISNEVNAETRQVVVYMNGNEMVYHRKNGRDSRKIKKILRQRYGMKI